jgi:metal-responsive CopG/Arc/MetJ family transcriptional regulator
MGRPPVKEAKQQYTIMLKPSLVKEIDRIAERIGMTRSQLMGNYIEFGMEESQGMERVGIIKAVSVFRRIKRKITDDEVSLDEIGEMKKKK